MLNSGNIRISNRVDQLSKLRLHLSLLILIDTSLYFNSFYLLYRMVLAVEYFPDQDGNVHDRMHPDHFLL